MALNFDFSSIEDYVANHLRVFILLVAGLLVFVGIIAVSVFFIAVNGEEQIMVPNVIGKELTEALLELQVKELYPRLQLRYSQTSADKGLILEQDPKPGSIVKAGRRIRLVVSRGVILDRVETFIGRNINDVRMDLLTVYVSSGGVPLLTVNEPLIFEYSSERPGTILAQKPEPGADISGPMMIEFVVSRGRENATITVPQLTGLEFPKALELVSDSGINFSFSAREKRGDEKGGTVVSQSLPADTVTQLNTVVQITVTYPDSTEGKTDDDGIFGIFSYTMPVNPYPLEVRLEALLPAGERIRLFTVNYSGGDFTVPYKLPSGTVLVLSMLNREVHRELVGG